MASRFAADGARGKEPAKGGCHAPPAQRRKNARKPAFKPFLGLILS
jgi:hypothetical protein